MTMITTITSTSKNGVDIELQRPIFLRTIRIQLVLCWPQYDSRQEQEQQQEQR